MTVTVEGRGRDGSATTGGSSRTGEGTSESWLCTLTAESSDAIGEPVEQEGKKYKELVVINYHISP